MRDTVLTMVAGAALLAVVLAGCSSGSAQPPPTSPGSSTTSVAAPTTTPVRTTPSLPSAGAPKVERPLDASAAVADPCAAAISPRLVQQLGLPTPGKREGRIVDCRWASTQAGRTGVDFLVDMRGLTDIYRKQQAGHFRRWEPTTVLGYPAVFADPLPTPGDCELIVGVSDSLAFASVAVSHPVKEQACAHVVRVAEAVIKTLQGVG
ncbi:DUF3558 family protein [Herbihabitans rhizosphaerae]|uniref:DUF3558 family protein n=1 Tax=Herbihabitans rhizosphaerae TaxID=1872711 RepID=UPI00102BFF82|nr:DUF3558 family protein [Herbihabitans rhizosphaerae]